MEKIHCVLKVLLQFKNISLCLFNATAESVNCSLFFLKNLETHFCNMTCKINFVKRIENLPQHSWEKFIGDNLSITDIALKSDVYRLSVSPMAFLKLSIIDIALVQLVQEGLSCPSLAVAVF